MKKRSILLTCIVAIMALAMFVGCDNAPVYPSFPTGGYISQIGDFVEGQAFDASKFQVVATYLDGSKKTMEGVSVVYEDTNGDDTFNTGDTVTAVVGYDYNDNKLEAKGTVTVYPIDHIEVVAVEKVYEAKSKDDINTADLTVTAYYVNGHGDMAKMLLSGSEYSIASLAKDPNADKEAAEVSATLTVSVGNISADTVITVSQKPYYVGNVASVDGIHDIQFKLAKYNYEELPEIDASKVVLTVTMDDSDTSGTTTLTADQIEGVELSYVDTSNGNIPLDERAGQYNLAENTVSVGIAAEYNGKKVAAVVNQYEPTIALTSYVEEAKRAIVEGTELPAINPDDYKAVLDEDGIKSVMTLTADDFFYADSATSEAATAETKMPAYSNGSGKIYVRVEYQDVYSSAVEIVSKEAAPAEFTGIEATVDTSKLTSVPAKQLYDAVPAMINKEALTVIASVDDGTTQDVSAQGLALTYYVTETEPLKADESDKYNLADLDQILVLVTWGSFTDFVTIDLAEPVATGAYLVAEYDKALGSEIDWYIYLVNNEGRIPGEITTGYKVWSGTASAELPQTVTDKEQGPYFATYNGLTTANTVAIPAGEAFVEIVGDNFVINLVEDYVPLYGEVIPTATDSGLKYAIDEDSWKGTGTGENAQPKITNVATEITGQTIEESNTVTITVTYTGKDGQPHNKTVDFTFDGIPYVTPGDAFTAADLTYVDAEGKVVALDFVAGQAYEVSKLGVAETAYTEKGGAKPTITEVKIDGAADIYKPGQSFTPASAGVSYQVTISYVDNTGKTATQVVGIAAK